MRQLTGELSRLRHGVELPCAPIHGDYKLGNTGELSDGSWATFDLDFARVRERLYDVAASLHHVARGRRIARAATTARRLRGHGSGTAISRRAPLAPRGAGPIPLHWAATAGLVGDGIHEAESAMTAAEAWWSRRANSCRSPAAALGDWSSEPSSDSTEAAGMSRYQRSRPRVPARWKARATAQGDSSAGGSVTSACRRRFASSYSTTSGCAMPSAGRCSTAERVGAPATAQTFVVVVSFLVAGPLGRTLLRPMRSVRRSGRSEGRPNQRACTHQ